MYKFLITKAAIKVYFVLFTLFILDMFIVSLQSSAALSSNRATNVVLSEQTIATIPATIVPVVPSQKTLRVLTWAGGEIIFPRRGHPQDIELDYLQQFADEKNLKIENIRVTKFADLIPKLLAGEGDVIAANLTKTHKRAKLINFSEPFLLTKEYW